MEKYTKLFCVTSIYIKCHPCFSMRFTINRNSDEVTALIYYSYPLHYYTANEALWYILVISYSN